MPVYLFNVHNVKHPREMSVHGVRMAALGRVFYLQAQICNVKPQKKCFSPMKHVLSPVASAVPLTSSYLWR